MLALCSGSKSWSDRDRIRTVMQKIISDFGVEYVCVTDGDGAPRIAFECAGELAVPAKVLKARWDWYGAIAGMVRNADAMHGRYEGRPIGEIGVVVIFHDNLDESRNSSDLISRAVKRGIPVYLVTAENEEFLEVEVGA